jgi:hypothetical protein
MSLQRAATSNALQRTRHIAVKQRKRNRQEDERIKQEKAERDRRRAQERLKNRKNVTPSDKN